MFLDVICGATLLLALIKGWRKGLIVALFATLAWLVGALAALRFSAAVAAWIQQQNGGAARYAPLLAFLLVFASVVLLVRLAARLLQEVAELLWLDWANRTAGAVLYAMLYLFLLSLLLFYAVALSLITAEALHNSVTAPWLQQLAPTVLQLLAKLLPAVSGWLQQLQQFFQSESMPVTVTLLPPCTVCCIFG
ncbi:MAG: CvpA family protein [Lacibacter sp.]